ncbi:MAG TPA: hypothetical protein VK142_02295 [Bacillota bacterium]|nr:hypothetical protein [Bacillota bacterium]
MKNKPAQRLTLLGIGLNVAQWIGVYILLQKILGFFNGYTIINPNVTNGTTVSFSFFSWLQSMLYSGVSFNIICFFLIVICLLHLSSTAVFLILEIVAFFMIQRGSRGWGNFILAMGIKNVLIDLSGVPFLVAGLMIRERKDT